MRQILAASRQPYKHVSLHECRKRYGFLVAMATTVDPALTGVLAANDEFRFIRDAKD